NALLCAIIIDVRASSCSCGLHLRTQLTHGLGLCLFDGLPPAISGSSAVATLSTEAASFKWLKEFVRVRTFPAAHRAAFRRRRRLGLFAHAVTSSVEVSDNAA